MPNLDELLSVLDSEFALTPVMAGEIECYVVLPDTTQPTIEAFWAPVDADLRAAKVPLLRIEKERGEHQFELVTQVMSAELLIWSLDTIRATIEHHAAHYGYECSFAAKPYADQPSNGMHIHLHLADAEGVNAFHKTEDWTSDALRWSMGGLLAALPKSMTVFFPNETDYARLNDVDHVPKSATWGVNNRYCALRIPAIEDPYSKRIEHRVPCANASPEVVVEVILEAVLQGLRARTEPPAQEFGKPRGNLLAELGLTPIRQAADELR